MTLTPGWREPAKSGYGVSLEDKYTAEEGRVFLTGVQALVRLTLEQRRLDVSRALNTSIFVTGYEGSPLGGLDLEFQRAARIVDPAGVVFRPGLNEELAATAVGGTQLLEQAPGRQVDGVTGFWYGKSPGLDRAADAIRHANLAGTAPMGGAVAWIGDDPGCKSSTVPSSCEPMARSLMMPLLAPSSVSEIIELGLHAVAMSRATGLWTALQVVADLADASATIQVEGLSTDIPEPDPDRRHSSPVLLGPQAIEAEQDVVYGRLGAALAYASQVRLNRVTLDSHRARVGIAAGGMSYAAVLRALEVLGLSDGGHDDAGLRLIKVGMSWPLDHAELASLTDGLDEVIVVEDKIPFLETELKAALFGRSSAPAVYGKARPEGGAFLPAHGSIDSDLLVSAIGDRLDLEVKRTPEGPRRSAPPLEKRRLPLQIASGIGSTELAIPARGAYFCSGCPHNISTRAADDQLVGVGIGCHVMVALDGAGRGDLTGMTQMGGEGAQWIGMAPFTSDTHFVQNLGDGTFFHSGSLAIRAAVAAKVNITYKLLYNDAVAMTGGQTPEGRMPIPDLTRLLALEGVRRTVITTPEPGTYSGVSLASNTVVRHRDDLQEIVAELATEAGVTVVIHDDRCAAEERRLRNRGKLPKLNRRVWINQRVCEGCGDCAAVSSCLSVTPVETEFGRKTAIHQSSCNQDFSCLKGDCPSFVVIEAGDAAAKNVPTLPVDLSVPVPSGGDAIIRMVGIGGTGIVTVAHVVQMAAHLDGWHAAGLDQTGLSQKAGPVVSDIRLSRSAVFGSARAVAGSLDVLLAFDGLGAARSSVLATAKPGHTVAIVNTTGVPTAAMVRNPDISYEPGLVHSHIDRATDPVRNAWIPAQWIAERLFGDHLPANMVLLGAALQRGCLPLSISAVEGAIRLNGASIDTNLTALHWGRAAAADVDAVTAALSPQIRTTEDLPSALRLLSEKQVPDVLAKSLGRHMSELIRYQDIRYASQYLDRVVRFAQLEKEKTGRDNLPVTLAIARNLYKLMAYKDEYEVARLHLDPAEAAAMRSEFGRASRGRVMLHPPLLRQLGLQRKISLGFATIPAFRVLRALRRLRGTPLDPFGRTTLRRVERALVDEYLDLMERSLARLDQHSESLVIDLAETPELVRGYEVIKLRNVERFREKAAQLSQHLEAFAATR